MSKTLRTLFRRPGFLAAAGLTLALGFGTNVLMFSVIDAVFLAPLPYADADHLVYVQGGDKDGRFAVSERELLRYGSEFDGFRSVGGFADGSVNVRTAGRTEKRPAAFITASLLPTLGASPVIGRGFTGEEDTPGGPRSVMLSHRYWQTAFNADPGLVGGTLAIDGKLVTVVGVMPEGFRLPSGYGAEQAQLLMPLRMGEPDPRNIHYLHAVARLADGLTPQTVTAGARHYADRLRKSIDTLPEGFRMVITPLRERIAGHVEPTLYLLYGLVSLLLLVACANVTCLSLTRAHTRMRELAIRNALGGTLGRLSGLVMAELALVFTLGGVLGLGLAAAGLRVLALLPDGSLPLVRSPDIDLAVLGYTLSLIALTGLGSALAPVLRLKRLVPARLLAEGGRHASGAGAHRSQRVLVAGQLALTFVLTATALLALKSLSRASAVDPGYQGRGVLTMQLSLPSGSYPDKHASRQFFHRLLDGVRNLPGVSAAGTTTHLPVADELGDWGIRIEGREAETLPSGRQPWADWMMISPGYLESMGTALQSGRGFDDADTAGSEPVVLINESTARAYWPEGDALGKRLRMSTDIDGVYRRVVGIVADTRHAGPEAPTSPKMFLPAAQFPAQSDIAINTMSLAIKAESGLDGVRNGVLSLIASMDPNVAASRVRTMQAWLDDAGGLRRLSFRLSGLFAVLALSVVAVGVYGLIGLLVAERRRELSIRMALGADRGRIRGVVMTPLLKLVLAGIAAGLGVMVTAHGWLGGQLFRVSALDPLVLAAAAGGLASIVVAAIWIPARRASGLAPMEVLRHE